MASGGKGQLTADVLFKAFTGANHVSNALLAADKRQEYSNSLSGAVRRVRDDHRAASGRKLFNHSKHGVEQAATNRAFAGTMVYHLDLAKKYFSCQCSEPCKLALGHFQTTVCRPCMSTLSMKWTPKLTLASGRWTIFI